MDLHHRYLVAGIIDVFVERDQPWLAGLDEPNESRHAPALSLELPCFESVGRDEDERRRHGAFLCRLVVPSMRWLLSPCSSSVVYGGGLVGICLASLPLPRRWGGE